MFIAILTSLFIGCGEEKLDDSAVQEETQDTAVEE
jgi:hypothetical protein